MIDHTGADPPVLTCEEVDSLAAAWALDAVPPEDLRAIDAHMLTCTNNHPLLAEYSEAAALLALSLKETAEPVGLRERILAEAGVAAPSAGGAQQSEGKGGPAAPAVFPRARNWWLATVGTAAILAAVAAGLGAWGAWQHALLVSQRSAAAGQETAMANALAALSAGGSLIRTAAQGSFAPVSLIQPKDGSAAYALVTWSPAPAGKSYQAWFIQAGQRPVSAAVFSGSKAGVEVLRLSGPITGVQTFAVTLEPAGGSSQPTSQPFLVSSLPS